MRILITGGAGYIGSHTAKLLARQQHTVVTLDDCRNGHEGAVRWGPLVRGDVADMPLVRQTLREHRIEGVVHMAASAYVGESMRDPRAYFRNNVEGSLALMNAMLEENVKLLVFSSSCATYGTPEALPITESTPQRPINPYGETKLMVERALHWYSQAYGLRSVSLRYFNAAGADPEAELGEVHDPETHALPLIMQAALGRIPHFQLFGDDYPTPDGTCIRDFIHVTDLADAHARALQYLAGGGATVALNLGTGQGYSVRAAIEAVGMQAGRPVPVVTQPRREGDPPSLIADPTKAVEQLGWRPRYSDLSTLVETAWRWETARSAFMTGGPERHTALPEVEAPTTAP